MVNLQRPNPDEVARRSLILAAAVGRCLTEEWPAGDADNYREGTLRWLTDLKLEEALTSWEQKLFQTPAGQLSERDRVDGSWLSEGLVVLAWALQICELPAADVICDPAEVCTKLGLQLPREKTVIASPIIRPGDDLQAYNGFILDVHWRIRDFELFGRRLYDFTAHLRPCDRFGLQLLNSDVAFHGTQLPDCSESDRSHFSSIVRERHRASNWLAGWDHDFYEVTTDT